MAMLDYATVTSDMSAQTTAEGAWAVLQAALQADIATAAAEALLADAQADLAVMAASLAANSSVLLDAIRKTSPAGPASGGAKPY